MQATSPDGPEEGPLLRVESLRKVFGPHRFLSGRAGPAPAAVEDVSFAVARGETFGLVGESGCGKSTIARCVVRVAEATGGRVMFDGVNVLQLRKRELQRI